MAVSDDDEVTSNRVVREMEGCIREFERQLERKTMEVETLKKAPDKARPKNRCGLLRRSRRTVPGERRKVLGVSRSHLHARLSRVARPQRRYHKADDATLVPLLAALIAARPTGYRHITALLNRQRRAKGAALVSHKRVCRIMQAHSLLMARRCTVRPDHAHDGKVVTLRSNARSPSGSNRWRLR